MRGTVIRRGKLWSVVFDLGTDDSGKRRREWHSGFRSKREAERARTELLSRLDSGTYVPPTKQTLEEYLLNEWLPAKRATLKETTLRSYRSHIEHHIAPHIGRLPLQKVSGSHLNVLYGVLATRGKADGQTGLSPASVRRVHATLSKAFTDAVRWQKLARNPALSCDPPKQRTVRKEIAFWSPEEAETFLRLTEGSPWNPLWRLFLATGLRRGEALGLRWTDVDFENGAITVCQSLVTVGYELRFSSPKSGKNRRVDIDPKTVATLRAHRKRQLEETLQFRYGKELGLVFVNRDRPLHPDRASKVFEAEIKKCGVRRIRLHDLRHSHGAHLAMASIHPKVVQERLGHHSIVVTLDTYGHLFPSMQRGAAEAVTMLLGG